MQNQNSLLPAGKDWQSRLKTGRNEPCPCGSGKKYKKCHLGADEKAESQDISKINAEATVDVKPDDPDHDCARDHPGHDITHKHEKSGPARQYTSSNTSRRINAPRKTGAS